MRRGELTIPEASDRSGLSRGNLYLMASRGKVLSRRVRGKRLVDARSLDAYLARQGGYDAALERAKERLLGDVLLDFERGRRLAAGILVVAA